MHLSVFQIHPLTKYGYLPIYRNHLYITLNEGFWLRPPRGDLRISSDRDDRMGAKLKTRKNPMRFKQNPKRIPGPKFNPPKNSHGEFPSPKNFQKALNDITRKIETLVLNTPKNPYLNQATHKKYLPKFSDPKKSFDHPCHLKSEVPPWVRPHFHTSLNKFQLTVLKKIESQLVLWVSSSHIFLDQGHFLLIFVNELV